MTVNSSELVSMGTHNMMIAAASSWHAAALHAAALLPSKLLPLPLLLLTEHAADPDAASLTAATAAAAAVAFSPLALLLHEPRREQAAARSTDNTFLLAANVFAFLAALLLFW